MMSNAAVRRTESSPCPTFGEIASAVSTLCRGRGLASSRARHSAYINASGDIGSIQGATIRHMAYSARAA